MFGVIKMFSDVLITDPLWNLRIAIVNDCCIIDLKDNVLILKLTTTQKIWEDSGFGRRLTYDECVFIAQGIRNSYNYAIEDEKWWADNIFDLIGAKETKTDSIFNFINVGLIGIFAFIGYKIINRK